MTGSQTIRVRTWLEEGKTLTSKEAWKMWGVTRLSAIIHNLRKHGYDIETSNEWDYNRYGDKVCFGRYRLKVKKDEQ